MAEYTIPRTSILDHDTSNDLWNSILKIDATHAFLAFTGTASDGFVKTFSWDALTGENITEIDVLEHDTADSSYHSVAKVTDTLFIMAYGDAAGDGWIKTFTIDGAFAITEVDSLEFDTADGIWTSIVVLNSTRAAVAYRGVDGDGFIKTFSFTENTGASIALVSTLEHDTVGPVSHNNLELVSDDDTLLMLAYTGTDGDGFIKMITVDTGTADNITEVAGVLEHDTVGHLWPSVVKIDATHAILAYTSPTNEGFMKTFSFTSVGASLAQIASLNYDPVNANHASMVLIDSTHVLVAHDFGAGAKAETLSFDDAYENLVVIDSWTYDAAVGDYNSLAKISDTRYIVAYTGVTNHGIVRTFNVFAQPSAAPSPGLIGGGISPGWGF